VPFGHLERLEPDRSEERFWLGVEALPVLHRASRVVGEASVACDGSTRPFIKVELRDDLSDVASERGDPRGRFGIGLILA
jgi:hypothetical protein